MLGLSKLSVVSVLRNSSLHHCFRSRDHLLLLVQTVMKTNM